VVTFVRYYQTIYLYMNNTIKDTTIVYYSISQWKCECIYYFLQLNDKTTLCNLGRFPIILYSYKLWKKKMKRTYLTCAHHYAVRSQSEWHNVPYCADFKRMKGVGETVTSVNTCAVYLQLFTVDINNLPDVCISLRGRVPSTFKHKNRYGIITLSRTIENPLNIIVFWVRSFIDNRIVSTPKPPPPPPNRGRRNKQESTYTSRKQHIGDMELMIINI